MFARIGFAIITFFLFIYLVFGPPVTEDQRIGDGAFNTESGQMIKDRVNALVEEARTKGLNDPSLNGDEIQAQRLDWMQRTRMYESTSLHNGIVLVGVADDWKTWSYYHDFTEVAAAYVYWEYPNNRDNLVSFVVWDDWGKVDPRRSLHKNMRYLYER